MATGQDAPCRGSRMTRTSWQKYLPPNCAPMPIRRVMSEYLGLQLDVPEAVPGRRPGDRQRVQVLGRRVLRGLERELRRRPADHDGQVIRRARRGAQRPDLLFQEGPHPRGIQYGLGLLVQEGLVRRAAPLGHEQELVLLPAGGVDLDLGRQVAPGVPLLPHGQRRELGVPEVQRGVRVVDAARDVLLVVPVGEHVLAALAHHDGGAGVLAHGQYPARRDARVLQQVTGDVPVVRARLRVVQDGPPAGAGARAAADGRCRAWPWSEQGQQLRLYFQEISAERTVVPHAVTGQPPVRGAIGPGRQQVSVSELRHALFSFSLCPVRSAVPPASGCS